MSGLLSSRWGNGSKWPKGCFKFRWVPLKIGTPDVQIQIDTHVVQLATRELLLKWQACTVLYELAGFTANHGLSPSFYASATCRVGPVAIKHFQVSTQRCYIYIFLYICFIWTFSIVFWCFNSARVEHIYMFEIMWFEISWHRRGQMTEDFSSSCFLFPFSNFLLSEGFGLSFPFCEKRC